MRRTWQPARDPRHSAALWHDSQACRFRTADLAVAARFYGEFIGLDLGGEPHQHDGNDALHYDLAWGDSASGDFMIFTSRKPRPGRAPDGEWGRNAVYQGPDGNIVSITAG